MPDSPRSNFMFRMMSVIIGMRNTLNPPIRLLEDEVALKPGSRVLDFGCGPGGYAIAAAQIVGLQGKVFALDIHPLALQMVERSAERLGLNNIETIQSDCETGLETDSLDTILLYDIFHIFSEPGVILSELNRVLKSNAVLSFSDHHMKAEDILESVVGSGLFKLKSKGRKTYTFIKGGIGE